MVARPLAGRAPCLLTAARLPGAVLLAAALLGLLLPDRLGALLAPGCHLLAGEDDAAAAALLLLVLPGPAMPGPEGGRQVPPASALTPLLVRDIGSSVLLLASPMPACPEAL